MSDALLRIERRHETLARPVANSDIRSYSVGAGETAVLLGPNGAKANPPL